VRVGGGVDALGRMHGQMHVAGYVVPFYIPFSLLMIL